METNASVSGGSFFKGETADFKTVLFMFEEISKIPRCSSHEEKIASWLEQFAKNRGLKSRRDSLNNVAFSVPASSGFENRPTLILQAHTDMVCEKEESSPHDFKTDGLKLQYFTREGVPYLKAEQTTLGADNGIGMAYMLALAASDTIPRPPLELLFTTDEEVGLTGAQGLLADFISGDFLINLDSEEEGTIIVGCAGGTQLHFKRVFNLENEILSESKSAAYHISLSGLLGGHSGTDIHIGRENANVLIVRFLKRLLNRYPNRSFKLIQIKGGTASNTIPRQATLSFVSDFSLKDLEKEATDYISQILSDDAFNDAAFRFDLSVLKKESVSVFSKKDTAHIFDFLSAIPNGVFEMSNEISDLVLVSGNLAVLKTHELKEDSQRDAEIKEDSRKETEIKEDSQRDAKIKIFSQREVEIMFSLRSGDEKKLNENINALKTFSNSHDFRFEETKTYHPWEADFKSDFVKNCGDVYKKTFGKEARVTAIHAGLECGVFRRLFPEMPMLSIGPDIFGAHTPDETLNLKAAEKVWIYLKEILKTK